MNDDIKEVLDVLLSDAQKAETERNLSSIEALEDRLEEILTSIDVMKMHISILKEKLK